MIVDVHSHAWRFPEDFQETYLTQVQRARPGVKVDLSIRYEDYRKAAPADSKAIVFGGKARLSGAWTDDNYVAKYVAQDPARLIGFLCVDPTQEGWQREMEFGHQELGLRGIKLLSMYAGFSPDESRLDPLWNYATQHRLPVLLHTGTTFISQAPLECTLPRKLDTVAIRFPEVKIIMAHLGHPFEGECIVTARKHPNVYADISALHYRPFQLYHSLMLVQEYGVWNKILFGTDFPFTTVNATIEGLRKLNDMTRGTGLPKLNEAEIEALIHRDALALLGLGLVKMKSERIGIVGLGLLGRGIAACFLGHGFEVVAFDRDETVAKSAHAEIAEMMHELVELGGFDPALLDSWQTRFHAALQFADLAQCHFIIESVTEDAAVKRETFKQLEACISPSAIIASNSSAIPISQLQESAAHPERFLAMHWAEPAHATRFLEIIKGAKTAEATVKAAVALGMQLGKEPVVIERDIPGFIVNRIGYAMYREAFHLLELGIADAETIDRSMRNALGLWASLCGPLRWIDLTGGPELYARAMQNVFPGLSNTQEIPPPLAKLAAQGARGVVNGRGFYNYTPEEAEQWAALYRRHAWRVAGMQKEYFPLSNEKKL